MAEERVSTCPVDALEKEILFANSFSEPQVVIPLECAEILLDLIKAAHDAILVEIPHNERIDAMCILHEKLLKSYGKEPE